MPMAVTMPKRSVIFPVTTPPRPKPSMTKVKASEAAPRVAPNSACTTGSATTTDHMPTLPIEPITRASASRIHAWRESGTKAVEAAAEMEKQFPRRRNFVGPGPPGQAPWRDIGHADAVQQMTSRVVRGDARTSRQSRADRA